MAVYTTLRVVNKNSGAVVLDVDELGMRDGTSRIFPALETIRERITATPLAAYMWTAVEGVWQVTAVTVKASVTGGAANTVDVLVCSGVTAPASGVTQLTAPVSLVGTAPFSNNGTLIASPTMIFPGDSVSRNIAGTVGSVEALLVVTLKRVS